MGDLLQVVQSQLRPGFKPKKAGKGALYYIINPQGEVVRDATGQPIGFIDKPGISPRRNSIMNLRREGVLRPRQRKTNTPKDYEKVAHDPAPKPTELAEAILRDTRATPRERKMAREYLNAIQRLDSTSHALQLANIRNDELASLIRRYVQERGDQSQSPKTQNGTSSSD